METYGIALILLLIVVTKYMTKSNLWGKWFVLAHSVRVQSTTAETTLAPRKREMMRAPRGAEREMTQAPQQRRLRHQGRNDAGSKEPDGTANPQPGSRERGES